MAHLISFRTGRFDVSKETPNPINPIAGQSVLGWLRGELSKADYRVTEPAAEDWGWHMDVEREGSSYLVGASADVQDATGDVDWIVQVHRFRSLKDKLLGRNTMTADDPVSTLIERIVRADGDIGRIEVSKNA